MTPLEDLTRDEVASMVPGVEYLRWEGVRELLAGAAATRQFERCNLRTQHNTLDDGLSFSERQPEELEILESILAEAFTELTHRWDLDLDHSICVDLDVVACARRTHPEPGDSGSPNEGLKGPNPEHIDGGSADTSGQTDRREPRLCVPADDMEEPMPIEAGEMVDPVQRRPLWFFQMVRLGCVNPLDVFDRQGPQRWFRSLPSMPRRAHRERQLSRPRRRWLTRIVSSCRVNRGVKPRTNVVQPLAEQQPELKRVRLRLIYPERSVTLSVSSLHDRDKRIFSDELRPHASKLTSTEPSPVEMSPATREQLRVASHRYITPTGYDDRPRHTR